MTLRANFIGRPAIEDQKGFRSLFLRKIRNAKNWSWLTVCWCNVWHSRAYAITYVTRRMHRSFSLPPATPLLAVLTTIRGARLVHQTGSTVCPAQLDFPALSITSPRLPATVCKGGFRGPYSELKRKRIGPLRLM